MPDQQIYAAKVLPAEMVADREARERALNAEIDRLARERGRVERNLVGSRAGQLNPSTEAPVQPSYGDVIVIMVDSGTGAQVSDEIAKQLGA